MRTTLLLALTISCLLVEGKLIKVFDFYGEGILKSGNDTFDFIQLDNDLQKDLPSKFTICFSYFQEKFSATKMLQFLDNKEQPWFNIYMHTFNQDEKGEVRIWMELAGEFLNFGAIEGTFFNLSLSLPISFRRDETSILVSLLLCH